MPKVEKTLVSGFIKKKLREYRQPIREGTGKGDPIGMKWEKFQCVLLLMVDPKLSGVGGVQGLAKRLKVRPGLLAKWKTEVAFRGAMEDSAESFAREFWLFIVKLHHKRRGSRLKPGDLGLVIDYPTYSAHVLRAIELEVVKGQRESLAQKDFLLTLTAIQVFEQFSSLLEMSTELHPVHGENLRAIAGIQIRMIRFVLGLKKIRDADKELALNALLSLEITLSRLACK